MTRSTDEETPLLQTQEESKPKETLIPWTQFGLVLFLQLAEPLTSQVIFPFTPQLIREIGITNGDDKKVGYYVGLLASLFFATQALTVLHWSRISDRVGRKPVILVGLFGLSISMYSFGLSRSYPALVISRCLNGALNGNIGVIKSMIGELTDSTNIARALSYQPLAWSSGSTLGPLIGGALAHPAERFPQLFGDNTFLQRYPYFLPCAIPATFSLLAWIVTSMFLKETNQTGFTFVSLLPTSISRRLLSKSKSPSDSGPVDTAPPPPLRSLLTKPVILSTATYALLSLIDIAYRALLPVFYAEPRELGGLGLPPSAIGTAMALLGLANGVFQIGLFARLIKWWGERTCYLIGIGSAIPIIILFPIMTAVVHLEDKKKGNMFLDPASEDYELSGLIITLMALQLFLTLFLNICYGSVFIYITAAAGAIPTTHHYARRNGLPPPTSSSSSETLIPSPASTSSSSLSIKGKGRDQSRPDSKEPLKKSKGGKKTLGAVNGLAQCVVSVMRCVGPYTASSLYAQGLSWQYGSEPINTDPEGPFSHSSSSDDVWKKFGGFLVYGVLIAFVVVSLVVGAALPSKPWQAAEDEVDESPED